MSATYLKSVVVRTTSLLEQLHGTLPDEEYQVWAQFSPPRSTKVLIRLVPLDPEGSWECGRHIQTLVNTLNSEFRRANHFRGIELEIPNHWADVDDNGFEITRRGRAIRVRRNDHG